MSEPRFALRPDEARLLTGRNALVTGADSGIGQGVAFELAAHGAGVAVNYLADSTVAEASDPKQKAEVESEIPLGRWGEVGDVARAVAWIASDDADYVVGSTVFVDGGMTLYPRFA